MANVLPPSLPDRFQPQPKLFKIQILIFLKSTIFLGCLVRATFFSLAAFIRENMVNLSNRDVILNSLPSFLFFSVYLIILFLWAEIYHSDSQKKVENFMPAIFVVISCIQYGALFVLYTLDVLSSSTSETKVAWAASNIEKAIFIYDFVYV